jgi:O-antigen/teichoic acid export membrane protein
MRFRKAATKINQTRRGKIKRLGEWAGRSGMALIDQGSISGSNFLLYIFLARWLSPAEYGIFALIFSAYMLLLAIHSSLIQEPLSVLGHVRYGDDVEGYGARIVRVQLLVSGFLAAPVMLAACFYRWFSGSTQASSLASGLLALAVSVPAMLLLWLARRMAYLRMRPGQAAFHGFLYSALLMAEMIVMKATNHVSIAMAFIAMAIASAIAAVRLLGKLMVWHRASGGTRELLVRHAALGKWLVAMALMSWLGRDAYYFLAAGLIGSPEAGALRAVGNFVTPLDQTQTALGVLLLPWLASLCSRDLNDRLKRRVLQIMAAMVALSIAYLAAAWVFARPLLHIAYKGKYDLFVWMVPWLVVPQVLRALALSGQLYLLVKQETRLIFYSGSAAALVAVCGVVLVRLWALRGLVVSMLLSPVVSTVLLITWFLITLKREVQTTKLAATAA